MLRRVPHRAERVHHIRLGLPLFRLQFVAEILVHSGRTCAVEQNENLEFLFHLRSFRAWVAHASRVLVSASRRNELSLNCHCPNELAISNKSSRKPEAFASTRDACATRSVARQRSDYVSRATKMVFIGETTQHLAKDSLLRALEFAGEKIIHHQRGDKSGDAKILLRIIIQHMQPKFITSAGKTRAEVGHQGISFLFPFGKPLP